MSDPHTALLARDPGYRVWLDEQQAKKEPLQPMAHGVLKRWLDASGDARSGDDSVTHCTFRYIDEYMNSGFAPPRLDVGLADMGYTRAEVDAARARGETSRDLARAILARGVASDSDSE